MDTPLNECRPQRPSLYELAEDGCSLNFHFARCGACAKLTFPANAPGCMHCGAALEGAEHITRRGGGKLLEFVTLHVPLAPGMKAPSIAGDIELAEGIVEEGVIGVGDEARLSHGMTLRAVAVPLTSGQHYGCHFVPSEEAAA